MTIPLHFPAATFVPCTEKDVTMINCQHTHQEIGKMSTDIKQTHLQTDTCTNTVTDRDLMFYAQATARGHIRAKQNVPLQTSQIPINCIRHISLFTIKAWGGNEVEWIMTETRKVEVLSAGAACKAIFWPTPGLEEREPLIALGSQQVGPWFLHPWYPSVGDTDSQCQAHKSLTRGPKH